MARLATSRSTPPGDAAARALLLGAALLAATAPASARADVFDLTLARLVKAPAAGSFADPSSDPAAMAAYRQLLSELSVGLAPRFLSPADTIGYNGFQFDIDYSFTTISNARCDAAAGTDPGTAGNPMNQDRCPWQLGVEGQKGGGPPPSLLHTVSLYARKGIWLPLPSFEIGAGATKLIGSNLYALQLYGKFALHEGFHDWPIPSLAVRGSALRVLGDSTIDLTMAQVDASISKAFGIAGTVTLVPYLGAALLLSVPRGQVLDITPSHDAWRDGPGSVDLNNNTVFPAQANDLIQRWRFFGGFRLNYDVLLLAADFVATAKGDLSGLGVGMIPDNSPWQYTFSLAAGFLF